MIDRHDMQGIGFLILACIIGVSLSTWLGSGSKPPGYPTQKITVRGPLRHEALRWSGYPVSTYTIEAYLGTDGAIHIIRRNDAVELDPTTLAMKPSQAWPTLYMETYIVQDGKIALQKITAGKLVPKDVAPFGPEEYDFPVREKEAE